jgi:glycosyltransferase involved in cell wall biosynthesis
MNVLFYSWEYPPNGAGVGTYVYHMARSLAHLGHRVMVVTGRRAGLPEEEELERGLSIRRCYGWQDVRSRSVGEVVLDLAQRHGADFIEGADHLGELASLMHLSGRPPLMVRMHSCNVHRVLQASQVWYPWQNVMIQLARLRMRSQVRDERISIEKADAVVSPCHRLLDASLAQNLRLPVTRGVVPNPYVEHPSALVEVSKATRPTVLFVGRLDMGKGIAYLPSMLKSVARRFPDVVLEIAGGDSYSRGLGSLKEWLQGKFYSVGVGARVRWLGHVETSALDEVYRRAWVQVVPSRWDTFPGVLLEGMARSLPLVVSPNGGIPEMVAGTGNAVADPACEAFANAVKVFLGDRNLREDAGVSGQKRVLTAYSPSEVGRHYMEFVETWLNNRSR